MKSNVCRGTAIGHVALTALFLVSVRVPAANGYTVEEQAGSPGNTVTIIRNGHRMVAPVTEEGQDGARRPKVSRDGRTVGWLAQNEGPYSTVLVLFRDGKVIHRIHGHPLIFEWSFGPGPEEVVLQQSLSHGPDYLTFTWVRLRDGAQLGEYSCDQDEKVHKPRPSWSMVVAVPCPDYMPPPPGGH